MISIVVDISNIRSRKSQSSRVIITWAASMMFSAVQLCLHLSNNEIKVVFTAPRDQKPQEQPVTLAPFYSLCWLITVVENTARR
jgi:hypothetical protein